MKKSTEKKYENDDKALLRVKPARAGRQRHVVKHNITFYQKVVLTMSNDESHISKNFFDLRK